MALNNFMKKVWIEDIPPVVLGRVQTNLKTITFDLKDWFNVFRNDGDAFLWYRRPADMAARKIPLQIDGTTAEWKVSFEDTEQYGEGEAQLEYSSHRFCIKSNVFSVFVMRDISTT